MRAVDLANMLREVLDAKINQTRRKTLDTYMPIEVEWLEARIWTSYQQQK
jgi:hypothetical protein